MNMEDRLTRLETKFDERWNAHDKRSEESWDMLQREFKEIKDIIAQMQKKMQCEVHAEQMKNMQETNDKVTDGLKGRINWVYVLLVPIIAAIVGAWLKR